MNTLNRFKLSELSIKRIYGAAQRRLADIPHSIAWNSNSVIAKENNQRLLKLFGKHKGERCFIMGNGPSLAKMTLGKLREEFSFGLNRIYLHFKTMDFLPTYYVAINGLVLEQFRDDIQQLPMPKFLNWNYRRLFDISNPSMHFLKTHLGLSDTFAFTITKPIHSGGTVTFAALQIAYYMGFQEVILIGVDHSFVDKGKPNTTEIRNTKDDNHFHPEYFPKGSRWQLPDLNRSELAYQTARDAFEKDGRTILDATVNGKCQVFPKVRFETLFDG